MLAPLILLAALAADDPADLEYFEKEVRPILAARCQSCHGSEKQKGELRLDSREAALKGGSTGPAVVPGKPEESVLVEAINYGDLVQMPPKSKLPPGEIAALTKWVERGAPWTAEPTAEAARIKPFDLAERAKHWSFRPIARVDPPAVADAAWPATAIDGFLLAALEAKGLKPAPDADRRTLIRRASYDLTGLPPTAGEIDAFLADDAPEAFAKVVDRLLASPRYGERWARHWLDLVRFAETSGHEFDYDIPEAWRYRDYVVRALNADLPYDRFLTEHVAGDLLPDPRRNPADGLNESVLATGFYFLGEGTHSPVDVREDEVLRIDNQIDVLSKAFLGLTVSCARCHDHKFDAIGTKDYYALTGFLKSSRFQHAFLDPPERNAAPLAELRGLKASLPAPRPGPEERAYFRAATGETSTPDAERAGLDPERLARWVAAVRDLPATTGEAGGAVVVGDFSDASFGDWTVSGDAFGDAPTRPGGVRLGASGTIAVPGGVAHSGLVSDRLQGVLRSRTFAIQRRFLHVLAWGAKGRINVVVDGFEKIRDPIYGGLTRGVDSESPSWITFDLSMWKGHRAYIELADGATLDYTGPRTLRRPGDGYLAVDEIRASDAPPPAPTPSLADVRDALDRFADGSDGGTRSEAVVAFLASRGLMAPASVPEPRIRRYREVEASIPEPNFGLAILDGTGEDDRVLIRGSAKTPGEVVPRRFLEAIAGPEQDAPTRGSGRLELARRMLDPSCPLTARVMVNRLWKAHFGVGLVKTSDDFGAMGEPPSHPELLDWLASEFVARGWSIKAMHRQMMLSRAYGMSSVPDPSAEAIDPAVRLLHRMPVRRLEAEAIRDAMLLVSGRLDETIGGPGVPPYLTPLMEGRGRPGSSGPLDGDGRRSLYLTIRRNFLPPMLTAFDFPAPASTMGRRNVSNVPAQALTMLNDPFVLGQAELWGRRLASGAGRDRRDRVASAYVQAFGRPPTRDEESESIAYLDAHGGDSAEAWASLAHALFNAKEFLFVP